MLQLLLWGLPETGAAFPEGSRPQWVIQGNGKMCPIYGPSPHTVMIIYSQQKQVIITSPGWGDKQLKRRLVEHICGLTVQDNRAGRREMEEIQFYFPVTPLI